jgi:hypothetical protein
MSREDYSAHSDMASRANKSVVLKATDSRRVLRDHVHEDQLSVTCCTVHRSYSLAERPPIVGNIEHFRRQRPEPNIQRTTRFFTSDFFGETPSQNYRERIRGCSIAQRVRASCNQCDRTKLESRSRAEGQQQYQKQCRDCHAPPICCPGASSAGREQDQRTTLGNGTAFSAVAPS